jgi:hypothetical protein
VEAGMRAVTCDQHEVGLNCSCNRPAKAWTWCSAQALFDPKKKWNKNEVSMCTLYDRRERGRGGDISCCWFCCLINCFICHDWASTTSSVSSTVIDAVSNGGCSFCIRTSTVNGSRTYLQHALKWCRRFVFEGTNDSERASERPDKVSVAADTPPEFWKKRERWGKVKKNNYTKITWRGVRLLRVEVMGTLIKDMVPKSIRMWECGRAESWSVNGTTRRGAFHIRQVPDRV